MRDILALIRRLALAAVVLSVITLPVGAFLLVSRSSGGGDSGLGDIIAFVFGVSLTAIGGAGLVLGIGLAVLSKRSIATPVELRGRRRTALVVGLLVAGGEVLVALALGAAFIVFVGLSAAFAVGYLVVAVAASRRGEAVAAGVIALALLGIGVVPLWGEVSLNDSAARSTARASLLPADMDIAIDAAAAAAPDGWSIAVLVAKGTNLGIPSTSRDVPESLIGKPLRGLLVVDCAGTADLDVVTMDDLGATVVIGSTPCRPEPQVMAFAIPGIVDYLVPPAYVGRLSVDPVPNDGSVDVINRALILVAPAGTPDPDQAVLLAAFTAAYGTERPR